METRTLRNTDIHASVVGLGCNNFGREGTFSVTQEGTTAVVTAALDAGVNLFDTADMYGGYGVSETLLGVALKGRFRGQTQRWFAFRFEGDESEIQINPPPAGHAAEFDEWAWKPMDELLDLIVPFKRGVYEEVVKAFRHLAG